MEESIVQSKEVVSQYVRVGDHIFLMSEEEQEDGYVTAGG